MRLGVDVDGVLADYNTNFLKHIIGASGRDLSPVKPFEFTCWEWPQFFGYTEAEIAKGAGVALALDDFWLTLPAYPEAQEALYRLNKRILRGDDIYFITNRTSFSIESTAKAQTEKWLRKQFSLINMSSWQEFIPTVIISKEKGKAADLLALDAYIDDKWENCKDVAAWSKTRTFLRKQPWNANISEAVMENYNVEPVRDVVEFLERI